MHDVVVIGAGLAGLRCAAVLAERGLEVVVLEAADAVGGRQRTDIVDGFRLDRGFQVLNPAYPALRRSVDLDALALRSFPVGVQVRTDRGVAAVRHPLRHPSSIARTIGSGLVSAADAVAFARWLAPAFTRRLSDRARDDRPLREAWDAAGLRGPLRTAVLEPFLAGVVAEADGVTSNAFVQELVRYFARGRPGLPAQGIAAVPGQLAARARAAGAEIRLGARAERVERDGPIVEVDVAGGEALRAGRVVVAVGPETVAELTPVPRPATNGLQTWWFAATHAPSASALLRVDGRGGGRRGPVVNTAVISHTAPSYAPAGRHLIEATCLLPRGVATAGEDEVRRHLAELWDAEVTDWQLLRRDDIPDALPTQPSPLRAPRQPRVADRVTSRATTAMRRRSRVRWRRASAPLARCSWTRGGDGRRGAAAVGGAHRAAGDRLVHRVRDGGDADVEHRGLRIPMRFHSRDRGVSRGAGRICRRGAGECGDRGGARHPPELVGACRRDRAGGRDDGHRAVRDSHRDAATCAPVNPET
ncbi:phytoene desaturase family protein [Microbacterium lacticum]